MTGQPTQPRSPRPLRRLAAIVAIGLTATIGISTVAPAVAGADLCCVIQKPGHGS